MKKVFLALVAVALLSCQQQPSTMETVLNTIQSRVSVREFTGEKISDAQIEALLRAGMAAPSAINRQP